MTESSHASAESAVVGDAGTAGATTAVAATRETALARRAPLREAMTSLGVSGITCANCTGVCCTAVANSMQITPAEALDLVLFLADAGRLDDALLAQLDETTQRYGLDRAVGDGRRSFLRRTYTCPFFAGGGRGCTIPPRAKPYGCLGFNARRAGVQDGEDCASDRGVLTARESADPGEAALNDELRRDLALGWDKLPLPVAVRVVADKVGVGCGNDQGPAPQKPH